MEFSDFRPYLQGDDFRRVDWAAYARLEGLFLRLYREEEDLAVHLVVDSSRSMAFGDPTKYDHAARVAAAVGYVALSGLDRVVPWTFGGAGGRAIAGPGSMRGRARFADLAGFLAGAELAGPTRLAEAARSLADRVTRRGVVVVLTDLMDAAGYEEPLKRLVHGGHEVFVVHVLAREEVEPGPGGDMRLIDSEGGARVDVSLTARAITLYRRRVAEFLEGAESFARKNGIGYARTTTADRVEDAVVKALGRAGLLA